LGHRGFEAERTPSKCEDEVSEGRTKRILLDFE